MSENFNFKIEKKLPGKLGRAGKITTPNGEINTPSFVVVGTKATVKAMTPEMLKSLGAQVVLANTYHLYLQPGNELVKKAGGFAKFMGWQGPTMTDSGGFQVFSLGAAFGEHVSKVAKAGDENRKKVEDGGTGNKNKLAKIDEDGVTFRSHINGDQHRFTPESSMQVQWDLGADMIFAFDECTSPQATHEYQKEAMDRTHRWAMRSLVAHEKLDPENIQALFGVVQGGRHEDLRKESAKALAEMKTENGSMFDGFGIGGSFDKDDMGTAVAWVNESLPEEKPRHLLGIGDPIDVFLGVENGCDLFDCVAPTRVARNGSLYTKNGPIHITNAAYRADFSPIEEGCQCYTCQNYTKAYLAHLFHAKEILANTLASVHNVYFIVNLVHKIREAILEDKFFEFKEEFIKGYSIK
ncbi:MAG: queuine tRNA-ribosyltransferase [Patescibacteria group bacterium]|jgi:queuine tRNA-ribosyltransferase|nr:queuine tRNA-ribosyltransferase [Patescibacteria group bacterium]